MRYTYIDEKSGKVLFKTNNNLDSFSYEMKNDCNVNKVIRIVMTEKYIISTYENGITLYLKKEIL